MKMNVYSVQDRIRQREYRVVFSETDGALCRDNIPIDARTQSNPAGLPFNDIRYAQIATYNTETHKFTNCEEREIDILKAYKFNVETPAEKVDEKTAKPLSEIVKEEQIKEI